MITIKVFHHAFGDNGKHVATLSLSNHDTISFILEEAFYLTNSHNNGWFENDIAEPCAKNGCRSTSVDDIISIESDDGITFYKVASIGFEEISFHPNRR